jgi:hypothetical protein
MLVLRAKRAGADDKISIEITKGRHGVPPFGYLVEMRRIRNSNARKNAAWSV